MARRVSQDSRAVGLRVRADPPGCRPEAVLLMMAEAPRAVTWPVEKGQLGRLLRWLKAAWEFLF